MRTNPTTPAAHATVLLPHDWLTWMLGGRAEKTTDHGDASGTGYYSPTRRAWLPELAAWALGRDQEPPRPPPHRRPGRHRRTHRNRSSASRRNR